MTRQEFNTRFAATQDTTEGFTDADLAKINNAVFAEVRTMDLDDSNTDSHVKNMFNREFSRL